ncbi:MAG: ATP-binding cassette domain-containing protein [Hyphomicrobiales bacterium]
MLEIKQVNLTLGDMKFAFNGKFEPQRIHAIIGRSGSGKSTLLNLIAGFTSPTNGDILWNQNSITPQEPHQRPITSLFQEHNLFAHLSTFKNIAIGLNPSLKLDAAQIELTNNAIKSVGLDGKADMLPKDLSGGEAQRVALARALARAQDASHPRPILLLDEPFSALDPETRLQMRDIILQIQQEFKLTILIISHNPTEMLDFADEISLIENGKIAIRHDCHNKKLPKKLDSFINI